MSATAIEVEGLAKRYRLGERQRYRALRDTLTDVIHAPFRLAATLVKKHGHVTLHREHEHIWALRDVTFSIDRAQVVGIVGRNGAGKSTLLKILTRITEPSLGTARISGRVGSLLEIGTGFHPELTGRDNIFLNGAILGMRRAEIRRKFDEIVDFSGVERFIDTPVKRYSSGMYVRLAFAVAAHLETDVLLVDEVLAVGDAAFQRKCLGKLGEVTAEEGRTVLFVSHNMSMIRTLCPMTLWLDDGRVAALGPSSEVIDKYLVAVSESAEGSEKVFPDVEDRDFHVQSVRLLHETGQPRSSFETSEPPIIEIRCDLRVPVPGFFGYIIIGRADGTTVLEGDSYDMGVNSLDELSVGEHTIRVPLPPRTFAPGAYTVYLAFNSTFVIDEARIHVPKHVASFTLDDFTSRRGNRRTGFLSVPLEWQIDP
jgi:lipopolysaccharide transport system ATP-binding protein